ncbi:PREDICTED: actin-1-like, partial [Tauraco erythrolophus]|uniref:actin-1-like n=1 Tax=Tauraco erythrolophus TaxID=121530 RepID=UPI0005235B14
MQGSAWDQGTCWENVVFITGCCEVVGNRHVGAAAVHPREDFPGNGDQPVEGERANRAGELFWGAINSAKSVWPRRLDVPAVIFDSGSGLFKAGITGDTDPRSVLTAVVGHPEVKATMLGAGQKECYIGEAAQSKRGVLPWNYLIDRGIVTCWGGMERIWRQVYECELRLKASERPVLLTEAPLNPLQNQEKMLEVMLEGFMALAVDVAVQSTTKHREHIQSDILRSMLLSGSLTLFQGFKERLLKELQTGVPSTRSSHHK